MSNSDIIGYRLHHDSSVSSSNGIDVTALDRFGVHDYYDDDSVIIFNNMYVSDTLRETLARGDLTTEEKMIVQRLAMKNFHLPGNGYWEDWIMFVNNNHIVLSFFFAHHLHPFGRRQRIINLVASLAFGLIATCCVVLYYYFNDRDMNKTIFALPLPFLDYQPTLSSGMLFLGIFGGFCNVLFDFAVWFLQACPPCQPGGALSNHLSPPIKNFWLWLGSHIALLITIFGLALAVYVTCLRASVVHDGNHQGLTNTGIEDYAFVASFIVEVGVAQFIMFPLVAGTIFSGVLGCCGRIPGVGGRPYQVRALARRKAMKERQRRERLERLGRPVWGEKPSKQDSQQSLAYSTDRESYADAGADGSLTGNVNNSYSRMNDQFPNNKRQDSSSYREIEQQGVEMSITGELYETNSSSAVFT